MALLKSKDIAKLGDKEKEEKLKELKFELIKAGVTANKANAKTKEIKRAISRLITFSNSALRREEARSEARSSAVREGRDLKTK